MASICGIALLANLSSAEEPAVSLSRFHLPLDTGKLIYAYPAVTVESSAWSSSFSAAPAPRTMPTAVTVQSSVWSSSFAPPPEPREATVAPPPPEPEPAAPPKPAATRRKPPVEPPPAQPAVTRRKAPAEPAPEIEPEPSRPVAKKTPAPKKRVAVEPEPPGKSKYRIKPTHRERPVAPAPEPKEIIDKEILPPVPEPSLVHVTGTAGYYSHYMFRGLDVGYRTGIDQSNESAFFGASGAVSIGNFAVGFWYMNSLDSYVPGGAGFDDSFGNPNNDLAYKSPQRDRYQEYDLFANYTFRLTEDLSLTTGMNFYWFSNGRFWAQGSTHVNNTIEAAASLNWTGLPWVNQTLSYYYDFDAFKGGYLEYKAAMRPIELYRSGDFAIGLSPNFTISYDFRYNGTTNGFNSFEPGLDVPIRLSEGLSLNFGLRYSLDLGDASSGANGAAVDRTDTRLWFSASLQYTFPTGESAVPNAFAEREGRHALPDMAFAGSENTSRWRVSAGAGMRSIHSNFDVGRAKPFNIKSLYDRKSGGGDLGLATDTTNLTYLDGTVYGRANYGDGTADFTVTDSSQITTDLKQGDGGINRQITYHSERYRYSNTVDRESFDSTDDDQIVFPYINLSYDCFTSSRIQLGVGVGYSFNHSSMDSGARLVGVQSAVEEHSTYGFIYNIDELFSDNVRIPAPWSTAVNNVLRGGAGPNFYLIHDAGRFDASYGTQVTGVNLKNLGPQQTLVTTQQTIATVATYRSATLDVDMHSISIPIDMTFKVADRLHTRLSFGPTLNLFDTELSTETYYQLLDEGTVSVTKDDSGKTVYQSPYNSTLGLGTLPGGHRVPTSITGTTGTSTTSRGSTQTTSSSGGKGSSDGKSRNLPGKKLARTTNSRSDQHFELGVFGQLTVQLDLDAAKRWFVEAYARYDYVPSFTVSDGATSATVDASSWGAGIGMGFRF